MRKSLPPSYALTFEFAVGDFSCAKRWYSLTPTMTQELKIAQTKSTKGACQKALEIPGNLT
jgi:hypothetical protein